MADDASPNNGEMHYTTPINNNQHWQSICNTENSHINGYSSEERSNSPLDFSFKRKNGDNEISGSDSVPSPKILRKPFRINQSTIIKGKGYVIKC
jgi:hypothetical protein